MRLLFLLFLQVFSITCAEVLGAWIQMPLATLIGMAVCGLAAMLGRIAEGTKWQVLGKYAKAVVAIAAILIPGTLVIPRIEVNTLDNYYAIVAWLIAATVFASSL